MIEQTIWLPPRATSFTTVCEACAVEHGYLTEPLEGRLLLERDSGSVMCGRGHVARVERVSRDPIGVLPKVRLVA